MFKKNQRVKVTNCLNLSGGARWQDMYGTVKKLEPGWVYVLLDERADRGAIPFRVRELSTVK
jgi:hypothetical protein